jgi:hypothetical protein
MSSLQNLTAADWTLHGLELEMLRTHLFRDHTPESLCIVAEPEVIAPSVMVCWYPEPPRRTLLKGGYGPSQFSIQHWAEDRYCLSASYVDYRGATYTRSSLTRPLRELPGVFVRCIKDMEREHAMSRSAKR